MGRGQFGPVVRQFRHLFGGQAVAGLTEWQLLRRYLDRRDEVAFGAIVERHGPMVLGACRRILVDPRDVEDAFQATFLILARKGGTLGEADPVGHWLYGVAHRVALRARSAAARRRRLERSAAPADATMAMAEEPGRSEVRSVIDEELARLPPKYRAPIVLCYLEGMTHEEAGRALGWPLGTVKGRLSRAREVLKGRLTRRGVASSTGAALAGLVREARAAVPPALLAMTMRAAMSGRSAGVVPAAVASLAAGSLSTMMITKMKTLGAVVLVLATTAAAVAYQLGGGSTAANQAAPPKVVGPPASPPLSPAEVADWDAGWPSLTSKPDESPMSKSILGALDDKLAMNFPTDTPLEDVLKYIREATKRPGLPNGIPIYVDPQGLQDSDKTMASTVSINLEEIPLKVTLDLALKQIALTYRVKDGLLFVTSANDGDAADSTLSILERKARRGELTRVQYRQLIEMLKLRNQVNELTNRGGGAFGGGFQ